VDLGDGMYALVGAVAGTLLAGSSALVRRRRRARAARAARGAATGREYAVDALQVGLLDALRVGVLVLADGDQPVLSNPAAREMGLVVGEETHTIVRTLAGQVRRTGVARVVELDLPRAGLNGRPLGVYVRAVALGDGYVAVEAADVTESHRLARVRRDFVANVSHELKTPVGALQLLAEALLDATSTATSAGAADDVHSGAGHGDEQAARRFAERILHESNRLGRLVSELLELSRLQGAEPLPEPEPVSLDRIIAEVLDRAGTPSAAKDIEVAFTGTRGLTVYGSESQLATAIANLVENAIAYSPESTKVTVTTRGDADVVEVSVIDQGIGIEPRDIDRIFERFYRADRARSRATGGTGLGLAIVKHIATNHGGWVDVTSTVGEGSTFTLRLPARPPDAVLPAPSAAIDHGVGA
jgi:two-component system, OmpR family, sensor histidine kinase SenX3